MNTLPKEIISHMVRLVPTSYVVISQLSRWFHRCTLGDVEAVKMLLVRQVKRAYKTYWALPNGVYHGRCIQYNFDGRVMCECDYMDGKRHGKYIEYNDSGKVFCECDYVNDKRHGKEIQYSYTLGKLLRTTTYVNNVRHGKKIEYNDFGKMDNVIEYENGEITNVFLCDHDESLIKLN